MKQMPVPPVRYLSVLNFKSLRYRAQLLTSINKPGETWFPGRSDVTTLKQRRPHCFKTKLWAKSPRSSQNPSDRSHTPRDNLQKCVSELATGTTFLTCSTLRNVRNNRFTEHRTHLVSFGAKSDFLEKHTLQRVKVSSSSRDTKSSRYKKSTPSWRNPRMAHLSRPQGE